MKKISAVIILIIGILVSACNFPLFNQQKEEPNLLATSVAETVQAMDNQPLPTQPPSVIQPTLPVGLPTVTPQPPAPVYTVQALPTSTPQPCDKAQFLAETIADDTEFDAGKSFNKSWTFKNAGTCTWNTSYKLIFDSGEAMGGPASVAFSKSVAPNDQITIEVPLVAPAVSGTYKGTWKLQAADATKFATVTVQIKVKSATFAVTSVKTNLNNVSPAACPHTYAVDVNITTSAAGTVTYKTETSEGAVSVIKTLKFDGAGTKTVEFDWGNLGVAASTTNYWLKVYNEKPNNQWFGPFNFSVTCPP